MATSFILFYNPVFQPLGNLAIPEPDAVLTVYLSNTTQLTPIYADGFGVSQLDNPITANGAGIFPPIYLDTSNVYHVIVNDQNGNQLVNIDPYYPIGTTKNQETLAEVAAGITVIQPQYSPGVFDRYGVNTTPGTTDMTAAIQAAVNQSLETGGAPIQGSGIYYTSASILNLHVPLKVPCNAVILRDANSFYIYPTSTSSNTLYRATTGNDSNDGLSPAQPFLTLQALMNAAFQGYGPE